mgnify:CR=1 FL=1|jgi:hypothetical protein
MKLLDTFAILTEKPDQFLVRGQVGVIVEEHGKGHFEIEFCNEEGETYAMATPHSFHAMIEV